MTIREFLRGFDNVEHILDIAQYGDVEITGGRFCISNDSDLYISVGGTAIAAFQPAGTLHPGLIRGQVYLIEDDQRGRMWEVSHQAGICAGPRPHTTLRLVVSG